MLILCEVLKWQATETAELLDTTVASVNSALQRARGTLAEIASEPLDSTLDPEHQALLIRYVDMFERYDIPALTALLRHGDHDDAAVRHVAPGLVRSRRMVR